MVTLARWSACFGVLRRRKNARQAPPWASVMVNAASGILSPPSRFAEVTNLNRLIHTPLTIGNRLPLMTVVKERGYDVSKRRYAQRMQELVDGTLIWLRDEAQKLMTKSEIADFARLDRSTMRRMESPEWTPRSETLKGLAMARDEWQRRADLKERKEKQNDV